MPKVIVFGLGPGSGDDLTFGTLKGLRTLRESAKPIFLRTSRHPTVPFLLGEGIEFAGSFDDVYESAETFENVYLEIADRLTRLARTHGLVGYATPGHPLLGERTVRILLSRSDQIEVEVKSSTSFIDASIVAAGQECAELVVVDCLSVPDPTDNFRSLASPFNPAAPILIYQVYDRVNASRLKLALLEIYSAEHPIKIICGAIGGQSATTVQLHLLDRPANSFDHLTSVFVPPALTLPATASFSTLCDIMAQLRHPRTGCPWDREQTPQSLKRYAVEEVYEVIDAIDDGDLDHYVEELGDLLLQVVFHAQIGRESAEFTIEDVLRSINEKLIRRHPHVFDGLPVEDSAAVLVNWEKIKKAEKGNVNRSSRLDGVPKQLPGLLRALEISKKAARAGFEWGSIDGVFEKLHEETGELKQAIANRDQSNIASELGDLLFTAVNIGRFMKVDPEDALRQMIKRFESRFRSMERDAGAPLEELSQPELESLWQRAKREQI